MSKGGSDALDKEIATLEKKLGIQGKSIKRGKSDKFVQDLGNDGLSEIFSFVDSQSVYNKQGMHSKLLEQEGEDLSGLYNFDYNFNKVRLEKRRNSSDDDIFGENKNFEECNDEFNESQEENDEDQMSDSQNEQENFDQEENESSSENVEQKVDLKKKPNKSILKNESQDLKESQDIKETFPEKNYELDSQTRSKYQELLTNKFKDSNNQYSFKTGRTFCQDVCKILNKLHDNYKPGLLKAFQESMYSSIIKLDYNEKYQFDNIKNNFVGSQSKIWIFSYLFKYIQVALKDSLDNVLTASLETIIVKLIKAMKLFQSVEKVETRHKKLLYMWIALFDAKIIGKEFFINFVVLVGEKLMNDCINDDLWLLAAWILRRNEPKGFVEMTKKLISTESWKKYDVFNSYKTVQAFFKDMKFNVYEPKKDIKAIFDSSKKLESVLYNEFFDKVEESDLISEQNSLMDDEDGGEDDDLSFDNIGNNKTQKTDKKKKKGKKNIPEQKIDPELKKFQETILLDINWEKSLNTSFQTENFLNQICNNKKQESEDFLKKRAHIDIPDSQRKNLEKLANDLGFTSVLENQTFIILMSSEGIFEALDRLTKLTVKRDQKVNIIKVIVNCCLKESPYNAYYTKVLSAQMSKNKDFKIGTQFAFWDQYRIFEQDGITNKSELVSFIKNFAKMFSALLIEDKLNFRAMRNFDISGEKDMMNSKQIMFMRLVIKEIQEKMDFQLLIKSTETLKRSDEDMMFRDSLYDFLKKIYKKQFIAKDFSDKDAENFQEITAKFEMVMSNIKVAF